MLGIEDYGSDSDSDTSKTPQVSKPLPVKAPASKAQKPAKKKITIALPSLSSASNDEPDAEPERPAKKQRTGAGVSSLLSMLPAPKEKNPVVDKQSQRVLGSGAGPGLNFRSTPSLQSANIPSHPTSEQEKPEAQPTEPTTAEESTTSSSSILFRPTSLAKGKKNISLEETYTPQPNLAPPPSNPTQEVDFFSLGSTSKADIKTTTSSNTPILSSVSAAPELPTYEPPEPTPTDPYPGYYQLPSGAWAMYDVEYYNKFMKKWEQEYNAQVRALEKGTIKGFEGLQDAPVEEIDALKEMEKAKKEIQEREAKKAITQGAGGAPAAPKMNINASKTSGIARSRHQLSTLLKEAYENREALEERIAQGKRNRKEAGNKYGT
ncbi:hypothetical protein CPC08DRAFT_741341 [Agrocybe pediades]|nr:hypothetical protein CPC08DRAFT_741341 [Agrocybe pediades]